MAAGMREQSFAPEEVPTATATISVSWAFQQERLVGLADAKPWRMNLAAGSQSEPGLFFVAVSSQVFCYRVAHGHDVPSSPFRKLDMRGRSAGTGDPAADIDDVHVGAFDGRTWDYDAAEGAPINSIRIGQLGGEEVLVAVDDLGQVRCWMTRDLTRPPIKLSNTISTWGIATHGASTLVAVSANDHAVRVWNMGDEDVAREGESWVAEGRQEDELPRAATPSISSTHMSDARLSSQTLSLDVLPTPVESSPVASVPPPRPPPVTTSADGSYRLEGHAHNTVTHTIPPSFNLNLNLNPTSCRDSTLRVSTSHIGAGEWNWSVRFVPATISASLPPAPTRTLSPVAPDDVSSSSSDDDNESAEEGGHGMTRAARRGMARRLLGLVAGGVLTAGQAGRAIRARERRGQQGRSYSGAGRGSGAVQPDVETGEEDDGATDREGWSDDEGEEVEQQQFSAAATGDHTDAEAGSDPPDYTYMEDGYSVEADGDVSGTVEDYVAQEADDEPMTDPASYTEDLSDHGHAQWTSESESDEDMEIASSMPPQRTAPSSARTPPRYPLYLLHTTAHDLRLLSVPDLATLAHLPRATRPAAGLVPGVADLNDRLLGQFDRCCFLEPLPRVGACVVGSQRGRCAIVKVVHGSEGELRLVRECLLPPIGSQTPRMPLFGVWTTWWSSTVERSLEYYIVYVLYYDGTLMAFDVRRNFEEIY
ncbi:hypothetical protein M427DRAFT_34648 [Gonapodya prolifera JEL478]|uniref:WD40 repeat-like protein n=1 Tax=Gonapodya prolifera (strain JEL478) TaxID=1344416 RepID=A0A139A746_GONPJ|nr:hypothetical protein M427DRAFT_34648 [Gonapodya prolifera JEL478]|eukprot:KXS12642.1 hypothetical protein M427DRAFT_34648 [Gonapodya prolifera JEL478]